MRKRRETVEALVLVAALNKCQKCFASIAIPYPCESVRLKNEINEKSKQNFRQIKKRNMKPMLRLNAFATRIATAGLAALIALPVAAETELQFWSWRQEDKQAYNEIIDEFNKIHPDIKITYTAHPATNYNTILTTALAGGEGPDIIHTRSYGSLETIAEPGYLEPLTDKVDMSLIGPNAIRGTTLRADGEVYAVPFASQTVLVYYNPDILAANDIAPPSTWEEFKAAAETLKAAGITPLANGTADGWTVEVMSGAFMPNFYGPDFFDDVTSGATDFSDPRYVAALEKFSELNAYMPDGYQAVDYATMKQLFMAGGAAMFVGGSWEIPSFRDSGMNFDIMPGPAAEAGGPRMVATFLDGGYGVNAASENKEAALEFIRFTATQEFGQMLTDKLKNISPIEGAVPNDELLGKITEMHKEQTPYIMLVAFRFVTPTGSTLLQTGLQEMFAGSKDATQVANDIVVGLAAAE